MTDDNVILWGNHRCKGIIHNNTQQLFDQAHGIQHLHRIINP